MDAQRGRAALAASRRSLQTAAGGGLDIPVCRPCPATSGRPDTSRNRRRLLQFAAFGCLLLVAMGAQRRSANYVVETADPELCPRGLAGGGTVSPRSGRGLARPDHARLVAAVRDDGPGRSAPRGRRRHHVSISGRRGVWLADDDSGLAAADPRFRPAARDHPHGLRQLLPPAAAALGRRGRRHDRRARQREETSTGRCSTSSSAPAAASPSTRCSP